MINDKLASSYSLRCICDKKTSQAVASISCNVWGEGAEGRGNEGARMPLCLALMLYFWLIALFRNAAMY